MNVLSLVARSTRARWRVEHCVGQLGLGTLHVKPLRHVTAVAALTELEASELAPPLARAPAVAACLVDTVKQVHTCAWSHADGRAGHIDYLVEPVTTARLERFDAVGPTLGWMVSPRR